MSTKNERLIEQRLIAPTQEECHLTQEKNGIYATLTVWSRLYRLTATGDNDSRHRWGNPGPGRLYKYDDQMWSDTVGHILAKTHDLSTIIQFVATHDEVTEDGDFSAEIRVHRKKIDGEPDFAPLRHTQRHEDIGKIPIYYED